MNPGEDTKGWGTQVYPGKPSRTHPLPYVHSSHIFCRIRENEEEVVLES